MKYKVIIEQTAYSQIIECLVFVKKVSIDAANNLYVLIMDSTKSLKEYPYRYPVDSRYNVANQEERKMVIGNGRYIVLYAIEKNNVFVEYFKDARRKS